MAIYRSFFPPTDSAQSFMIPRAITTKNRVAYYMDNLGMRTKRKRYLSEQEVTLKKRANDSGKQPPATLMIAVCVMIVAAIYLQVTR